VGSEELAPLVVGSPIDDPQGDLEYGMGLAAAALGQPDAARDHFVRARARFRASGQFMIYSTALERQLKWLHIIYATDNLVERDQLMAHLIDGYTLAAPALTQDISRFAHLHTAFLEGAWDEIATTPLRPRGDDFWQVRVDLARLAHARGEQESAWEHIRAVFPQGPPNLPGSEYRLTLWLIRVAGALALDAADIVTAREWLQAHDRWQAWSGCVPWRAEGELLWARYESILGHRTQAQMRAARALALASQPRQPLALLAAHRMLGELTTGSADAAAARAHLDAALALADACRTPYERALTLLAMAELDATTGETTRARAAVDEARAICVTLGARPALTRADTLAARLATAPSDPALPAGLTEREAEVLSLVTEGLTNTQVAERLFISRRTVEFHLSSIYSKLGVSSRAAATRFAVDHGLT
jgi:ATP/maltotriose-dependent transcriptional regulator MalT